MLSRYRDPKILDGPRTSGMNVPGEPETIPSNTSLINATTPAN